MAAVNIVTSVGDILVSLLPQAAPENCRNFVNLCKAGYYDQTTFHYVVKDFIAQAGDPTGTGGGGKCFKALMSSASPRFIPGETHNLYIHSREGILGMALVPNYGNASHFYLTLGNAQNLDGRNTVIGLVTKGFNVLGLLRKGTIIQSIHVLLDPWKDDIPLSISEVVKSAKDEVLEDLDAKVFPQNKIIHLRNLNACTSDYQIRTTFSAIGAISSVRVLRDASGASLGHAFVEFEREEDCRKLQFSVITIDHSLVKLSVVQKKKLSLLVLLYVSFGASICFVLARYSN